MSETTGVTVIDVLDRAWRSPFRTKSDFARLAADVVAMCACDGFITTRVATGLYVQEWRVTPKGLTHLFALKGLWNE